MKNAKLLAGTFTTLFLLVIPTGAQAAIAFGGISTVNNASSQTSVTVSGTNTIGFVTVNGDIAASNSVTAITWGGVSMTKLTEVRIPSSRWHSVWWVANPSSAATISFTGGTYWRAVSYYYTGAKQTGQPDASAVNSTSSGTSISATPTVVASNSWVVMSRGENAGGKTDTLSGVLASVRLDGDAGGIGVSDSNGTVGTGAQTGTTNLSGGTTAIAAIVFSIAPASDAVAPSIGGLIRSFWIF